MTADNALRIDLPGLRAALSTIENNSRLIAAALRDLGMPDHVEVRIRHDSEETSPVPLAEAVAMALDHLINDDYRSAEDPGGS